MSTMCKALKALSIALAAVAVVLVAYGVMLFLSAADDTMDYVSAFIIATCVYFNILLGKRGYSMADDPDEDELEKLPTNAISLAFLNFVAAMFYYLWDMSFIVLLINGAVFLAFGLVSERVRREAVG